MSRMILGLVALSLVPSLVSAQSQTVVIQGPDGAAGFGTFQTDAVTGPALVGQPPARDAQPAKTGTAQIRGRILAADGGEPLRRASVRLSSPELREGRGTTTDAEGRYEFRDLPAGRYTVSASKNGYVMISYGQRRPNEPGRPLDLADKQVAEKVDFALPRGGIITGRVIDEYGEPVANAMVQSMTFRAINGERRPMPMGSPFTTPDTGEFRLWGLGPGDYFVMVNTRGMMNFGPSDDRTGYLPTYYPGTPNIAEAQPIAIVVGQTASGVDVQLAPARTVQVSGTAINSNGQPIRNGSVMAMSRAANTPMMGSMAGGMIRPDGTFVLNAVPPGDYTLRAMLPPTTPGQAAEMLTANVSVGSNDVTGVVLAPTPPIKVVGKITLDPPSDWLQPSMVRLMVMPKNPGGMFMGPGGMPVVHDDFSFEAPATPGTMMIRAMPIQVGAGPLAWSVKSIRVDNVEVIDSGVELVAGRDLSGVEIVVTNRLQIVSGLVTNDRGQMAQDATVLVFPQDPELRTSTRFEGQGRPDQNGRYSVRSLPAGDYFAVATDYVDQNRRGSDPSYLEQLSLRATRFTLQEGETRTLDLKVIVQ